MEFSNFMLVNVTGNLHFHWSVKMKAAKKANQKLNSSGKGFIAVKRKKLRHVRSFKALKSESVHTFASVKFVGKRYMTRPNKPHFTPIKLVDDNFFILNTATAEFKVKSLGFQKRPKV